MAAEKLTYATKRAGDPWTHQEVNSIKQTVNEHADELDALNSAVTTIDNTVTTLNGMDAVEQQTEAGTAQSPIVIMPNRLNKWGAVSALYITFSQITYAHKRNEYCLRFTVDGDGFTLSLPGSVRWMEEPDFEDGWTYEVSIENNLALYAGWEPASQQS